MDLIKLLERKDEIHFTKKTGQVLLQAMEAAFLGQEAAFLGARGRTSGAQGSKFISP